MIIKRILHLFPLFSFSSISVFSYKWYLLIIFTIYKDIHLQNMYKDKNFDFIQAIYDLRNMEVKRKSDKNTFINILRVYKYIIE